MASVIRGSDNMDSAQVRPVLMAAQTASGTSVDFTGIPSWAKRITVMFSGLSTNGTSNPRVQIGTGSVQTSGYLSSTGGTGGGAVSPNVTDTAGFTLTPATAASSALVGHLYITQISGNRYVASGVFGREDANANSFIGGAVTLTGALDRVRITTVNGTDAFDAGTISVMYE